MKETKFQKIVDQVSTTKNFALLEPYRKKSAWNALDDEEKFLLAEMFLLQGEEELFQGAVGPIPAFDSVNALFPGHSTFLYRQASCYSLHASAEANLLLAAEAAELSFNADGKNLDALILWANSLRELGLKTGDVAFFQESNNKFELAYYHPEFEEEKQGAFFWHWGILWHFLSKASGEPSDFKTAIEKYQRAESLGTAGTMFWNDWANALVDMACLLSHDDLLLQASKLYQKVVESSPSFFEGWFNLACTEEQLWFSNGEEKHFYSAHKSFEQAVFLNGEDGALWFKWAMLLFQTGKNKNNQKLLESAIDKFAKANTLEPDRAPILATWAEAQMMLGMLTEKLDYLKWAEGSAERACELEPDESDYWVVLGRVLIEQGRYFEDEEFLLRAIQKLQYGLSISRENPELWFGLASAHHIMAEIMEDMLQMEKAAKYYSQVMEFDSEMYPAFWNEWGVALIKLGEYTNDRRFVEAAAEKFEHTIRLFNFRNNPATIPVDWLYNWGSALDFLGDFSDDEGYYEKAIKVLSQALVLDPDHFHAKLHLALAFTHLGELVSDIDCFQKAQELFGEVLSREPEDDGAWNEWGLSLIHHSQLVHDPAHKGFSEKLMGEAEEKFMRSAALGNESAYYNLACLHSLQGNFPASMHFIERAFMASALPRVEDMVHDEWLSGLRGTSGFQEFLKDLSRKEL